jgi:glycine betaine/proline transport system ATP-binding protein
MIDLVGLGGREGFYPRELSGGQQQRVGIARSLAVEPEVWFLDEPFSALDPLIRREMQDEFMRLQAVLKKSIVFITHDFDEAIRVADRIAIMKDGAVVQTGSPEEIVMAPADDDYVAEFTRNVSKSKVVRCRQLMKPLPKRAPAGGYAGTVMRLRASAMPPRLFLGAAAARVTGPDGKPVGRLDRQMWSS